MSVSPSADLSAIEVSDAATPEITVPAPWAITSTQTKVLKPGGEQKLTDTSTATVNYIGVNGRTGEVFDQSYDGDPATFSLERVIPGFTKGLSGQSVGSRVLIGMPSEDGYAQGNPGANIEVGDSLLFVVDIISANYEEAIGEAITPAAGLPTVTMTAGKPEIALPAGVAAPTDLKVQPLIKGAGAPITADSTISVKFRSWNYADGTLFQDAWEPQSGALSTLIDGWKEGLVGQTAGSRVLLVVPPAKAFPDGIPTATPSLAPGQTLVYVLDILDVQG
ncbi:MAG TPA: FKBP-type peptidyl-prolyl cis-trans isomerase [Tessaracoccus flavescens]|uniref:Peptidyl-prolyl cis-trans isomerase n=1 Tax=Tessaracoccus flavescens TaxID=399497 RepID=A0A921JQG2_9ACTN|nr:FKBP-type peptidyl-prolyl cis-trans isomerase [Tessaracoccus flavescens]